MTKRILRGDAPEQAQISRLASSATGLITLGINGKTGVAVSSWDAAAIAAAWNASTLPEFAEITAAVDGADVLLTSDTPGQPFEVSGLVNGEATADDEQLVTLSPADGTLGGTFPLTFDGQTTAGIAVGAAASAVQTAMEALSNLAPGDVVVSGPAGGPWRVRFTGARADVDQPELTTDRANVTGGNAAVSIETLQDGDAGAISPLLVTEETAGGPGTNEQRRFRFTADPGVSLSTITLRFQSVGATGNAYSTTFPADASLATIKAALGGLTAIFTGTNAGTTYGVDNLTLTGSLAASWVNPTDGVLVEFGGVWAGTNINRDIELVRYAGPAASLERVTVQDGDPGPNEIQSLRLIGPTVGTGYRLKLGDKVTDEIAWTAQASEIAYALSHALGGVAYTPVRLGDTQQSSETLFADYSFDGILYFEFWANGYQSTDLPLLEVLGVGAEEIQQVGISADSWKGQVTLTLDGQTAAALDWDTTAGEAEAALEALSNVGAGLVTCYGGPWPAAPIVCEFDQSLGNLPQMTATHTLTNAGVAVTTLQQGGAAVVVTEVQRSRGPLHWDDPLNWADDNGLPGVPGAGDPTTLDSSATALRYGLRQRCEFIADPATDRLTLSTGRATFWNGQSLRVRSSTTLPGGLSDATTYYAVNVDGPTLQLSLTAGGDAVAITNAGTGTHEIGVRLPALYLDSTFTQDLGLPRTNEGGYDEYRPQSLELWADVIEVGNGQGSGSNRTRLDTGLVATALEVIQTGGSIEPGVPALLWQGDHAANTVENVNGDVGIGFYAEDSAQLALLVQRGGNTVLGRDVDVAQVKRTGGTFSSLGATINGEVVL